MNSFEILTLFVLNIIITILIIIYVTKRLRIGINKAKGIKTSKCGSATNLWPVHDPEFNLREIIKQMILLEDHMFQEKKRCKECITKHFLTIYGFAEEGITLDTKRRFHEQFDNIVLVGVSRIETQLHKDNDYDKAAKQLRDIRKSLMPLVEPWIYS